MSKTIRTYNWNKLRNWLNKQIGENVNTAYSDYRSQDSLPKHELNWNDFFLFLSRNNFYVDENFIIRKTAKKKKKPRVKEINHIPISEYEQIAKDNGIWFRVELRQKIEDWFYSVTVTNKRKRYYKDIASSLRIPARYLILKKQQLSSKELRKYGLSNEL